MQQMQGEKGKGCPDENLRISPRKIMVVKNLQEAVEKSGVNFPNPEVFRMQKTGADWNLAYHPGW